MHVYVHVYVMQTRLEATKQKDKDEGKLLRCISNLHASPFQLRSDRRKKGHRADKADGQGEDKGKRTDRGQSKRTHEG